AKPKPKSSSRPCRKALELEHASGLDDTDTDTIDALREAKRTLEIKVSALESEVEELQAENKQLKAQLVAASSSPNCCNGGWNNCCQNRWNVFLHARRGNVTSCANYYRPNGRWRLKPNG